MSDDDRPTCFIAMPITTHADEAEKYRDVAHWAHVRESLFVDAIEKAGMRPVRPEAIGTDLIHARIIKNLIDCDMVLCDLSSHNPNVFFELGVRTSLNQPITLVKDEHLKIPFDTNSLNVHPYKSDLRPWDMEEETAKLAQHITDSVTTCAGGNPLWGHFGLTMTAQSPTSNVSPTDARLDLMAEQLRYLTSQQRAKTTSVGLPFPDPDAWTESDAARGSHEWEGVTMGTDEHMKNLDNFISLLAGSVRAFPNYVEGPITVDGNTIFVSDTNKGIPDNERRAMIRAGEMRGFKLSFPPF